MRMGRPVFNTRCSVGVPTHRERGGGCLSTGNVLDRHICGAALDRDGGAPAHVLAFSRVYTRKRQKGGLHVWTSLAVIDLDGRAEGHFSVQSGYCPAPIWSGSSCSSAKIPEGVRGMHVGGERHAGENDDPIQRNTKNASGKTGGGPTRSSSAEEREAWCDPAETRVCPAVPARRRPYPRGPRLAAWHDQGADQNRRLAEGSRAEHAVA